MIHNAYTGINVLDLSQGVAGPYCTQILQQLGASVLKVEPLAGDWSRAMGTTRDGLSALSIAYNRGKRSIAVNYRHPDGLDAIKALAAKADVIVQNFRPGVVWRMGLDFDTLVAENPRLVYASISGFGSSGPYKDRPATDSIAQAISGLARSNAASDGAPALARPYIADISSGMYASQAIAAALFSRERSGEGLHVEVSLVASLAALQNNLVVDSQWSGQDQPAGRGSATIPQGLFETADGHLALAALNDAMFFRIAKALGLECWLTDPRMATASQRLSVADEIQAEVCNVLRGKTSSEWDRIFSTEDILCAPVNRLVEFLADSQTVQQQLAAPFSQPINPMAIESDRHDLQYAGFPGAYAASAERAPFIGEHSQQVLRELGYADEVIEKMLHDRAIGSIVSTQRVPDNSRAASIN